MALPGLLQPLPSPRMPESEQHMVLYLIGEKFSGAASEGTLRCRLWGRLPEDVLEKVLLWLPAPAQARFRAVCKGWRSLLSCSKFLELSASLTLACRAPICAFQTFRYVFRTKEWDDGFQRLYKGHKVDFMDLPGSLRSLETWQYVLLTECGLVCIAKAHTGEVFLVNLANKTSRELPPLNAGDGWDEMVVAVAAGEGASPSFRVLVLWTKGDETFLGVYSSRSGEWRKMLSNLQANALKSRHQRKPLCVVCKGLLYVLVRRWRPNAKLLLLDAGDGRLLSRLELPHSLPNLLGGTQFRQEFVSVHNGRIFWTAQSSLGAISIWMMDDSTREWSGLCFSENMMDFDLVDVQLVGGIMFLVVHKPEADTLGSDTPDGETSDRESPERSTEETHLLAYNIVKNSWYSIWQQPNLAIGGWIHLFESRPALQL